VGEIIPEWWATSSGISTPRTAHHVHTVLGACLATAHRKAMIAANPMMRVEQVPNPDGQVLDDDEREDDIGEGLDEGELKKLVAGFSTSSLFPVVVLAAATGARRNELLALRWTDLDVEKKTLRIERAWEQTKKCGLRLKPPKTKRGMRTIELDEGMVAMLLREKERHQRIIAGVPVGVSVDLSLVKLMGSTLMFPALPEPSEDLPSRATPATSQRSLPARPISSGSAGSASTICAVSIRPPSSTPAFRCIRWPSGSAMTRLFCFGTMRSGNGQRRPISPSPAPSRLLRRASWGHEAIGSKLGPRSHCVRQELPLSD
jgi:hypothetical protein